jgi:hypothetical protein
VCCKDCLFHCGHSVHLRLHDRHAQSQKQTCEMGPMLPLWEGSRKSVARLTANMARYIIMQ